MQPWDGAPYRLRLPEQTNELVRLPAQEPRCSRSRASYGAGGDKNKKAPARDFDVTIGRVGMNAELTSIAAFTEPPPWQRR
jgi:hypothetical protein